MPEMNQSDWGICKIDGSSWSTPKIDRSGFLLFEVHIKLGFKSEVTTFFLIFDCEFVFRGSWRDGIDSADQGESNDVSYVPRQTFWDIGEAMHWVAPPQ